MGFRATKYLLFKIVHNYIFEINAATYLDLKNMPEVVRGFFMCNKALISITTRTISKQNRIINLLSIISFPCYYPQRHLATGLSYCDYASTHLKGP